MQKKRPPVTPGLREDTRAALGHVGSKLPNVQPKPPKAPVSAGKTVQGLLGNGQVPTGIKRQPKPYVLPGALSTAGTVAPEGRTNHDLDDVFAAAPPLTLPKRLTQHLRDLDKALGGHAAVRGLLNGDLSQAAKLHGLRSTNREAQRLLAAYNWHTLGRNVEGDRRLRALLEDRHVANLLKLGDLHSSWAKLAEYHGGTDLRSALMRLQDERDDEKTLADKRDYGADPLRPNDDLDAAFGMSPAAVKPKTHTAEGYLGLIHQGKHARLQRRKGRYGLIAPDGTWHEVPGHYGHSEVAQGLGFADSRAAQAAGYMHVSTDGHDHGSMYGHNPTGEYTGMQMSTLKRMATEHGCREASVHKVVGGENRDFVVRLSLSQVVGRVAGAALGHQLGSEVTEGAGYLGAGIGAAQGLFGAGLSHVFAKLRSLVGRAKQKPLSPRLQTLVDQADHVMKLREASEDAKPVPARTLETLRAALRSQGYPEHVASDPDVANFWHHNVHGHIESAVAGGQAGTLTHVVRRGMDLLRTGGFIGAKEDAPVAHDPAPVTPYAAGSLVGNLDAPEATAAAQKPKKPRKPRKKPDPRNLFSEFE